MNSARQPETRTHSEVTVVSVGGLECAIAGKLIGTFALPQRLNPVVRYQSLDYMVLDLPQLFGTEPESEDRLLLLFTQGEVRRALVVDRLIGPIEFAAEDLCPVPAFYPQVERDCWRGLLPTADGRLIAVPYLSGLTRAAFVGSTESPVAGSRAS